MRTAHRTPTLPACGFRMTGLMLLVLFVATLAGNAATPETSTLLGDWILPDKAVTRVFVCDHNLCIRVLRTPPNTPETTDQINPNQALRSRSLCGLVVGTGFQLADASHADGGDLYDPKSGKTYHGSMAADGNQLNLRGYIGLKIFGRTETWTRAGQPVEPCSTPK